MGFCSTTHALSYDFALLYFPRYPLGPNLPHVKLQIGDSIFSSLQQEGVQTYQGLRRSAESNYRHNFVRIELPRLSHWPRVVSKFNSSWDCARYASAIIRNALHMQMPKWIRNQPSRLAAYLLYKKMRGSKLVGRVELVGFRHALEVFSVEQFFEVAGPPLLAKSLIYFAYMGILSLSLNPHDAESMNIGSLVTRELIRLGGLTCLLPLYALGEELLPKPLLRRKPKPMVGK